MCRVLARPSRPALQKFITRNASKAYYISYKKVLLEMLCYLRRLGAAGAAVGAALLLALLFAKLRTVARPAADRDRAGAGAGWAATGAACAVAGGGRAVTVAVALRVVAQFILVEGCWLL